MKKKAKTAEKLISLFFKYFIYSAISVLITTFIIVIISLIHNENLYYISYISAVSSFLIALLTIIYVYNSSRQLEIMKKQLDEIQYDRELQIQPFPYLNEINVEIEKPKLYFTPPTSEHSFQSRYRVISNIINLSSIPAICIDITASIHIPNKKSRFTLDTVAKRVDVLDDKINNKPHKVSFLFSSDCSCKLYEALRTKSAASYPRLEINMYYRNLLGGCFTIKNEYYILPNLEKEESILNWHTNIASFYAKYSEKIAKLKLLRKTNIEKWNQLFEEIQKDSNENSIDDKIVLDTLSITGKFNASHINKERFTEITKDLSYGHYLGVGKK